MITPTEYLLLQRYDPTNPKLLEPLESVVGSNVAEVLPVHKVLTKASDMSAEELAEMIEVELRNRKLVEAAKKAQEDKIK